MKDGHIQREAFICSTSVVPTYRTFKQLEDRSEDNTLGQ